jgi:uncharacterized membrane protein
MPIPLINDVHLIEGIIGGVATLVFYYILSREKIMIKSHAVRLGIAFILTWIVRKIGVNIYTSVLVPKGMKLPTISI